MSEDGCTLRNVQITTKSVLARKKQKKQEIKGR